MFGCHHGLTNNASPTPAMNGSTNLEPSPITRERSAARVRNSEAALASELALLVTTLFLTRAALRSRVIGLGSRFVLPVMAGVGLALLVKPWWQPNIHPLFDACLPAGFGALTFILGLLALDAQTRGVLQQVWQQRTKPELEP